MASFSSQVEAARVAHLAASAVESRARNDIARAFRDWDNGLLDAQSVRWRLEATVRAAYRSSAALAAEHATRQAGIPEWSPQERVFRSDYLDSLILDIRRNLREFKASDRGEKARRRAILRMQHGAGVGAQRGYTDALISAYAELQDFGYQLRKVWLANFVNNTPCEFCQALHGTEVGLHEEFSTVGDSLKVYGDLKGPPRHPQCKCYLVILTVTLENAFDRLDLDEPFTPPSYLTTEDVRKMPRKVFDAVVTALRTVVQVFRGGSNG